MNIFEFTGKVLFEDTPKLFCEKIPKTLLEDIPDGIEKGFDSISDTIDKLLD